MRALLDVSVLIPWVDREHAQHQRVARWLNGELEHGWASCAVTQNGMVRILSQPTYSNPISTSHALRLLAEATGSSHHEFWDSWVQVCDASRIDFARVLGPAQVTDVYLLALATSREARLVTLDRSIPLSAVREATQDNLLIL